MLIGMDNSTVTTDTAGVPHGGQYGDVDWFEEEIAPHGLKLGWNPISEAFIVYVEDGPDRFHTLIRLWKDSEGCAIPMTHDVLWMLLYCWDNHCRNSKQTVLAALQQMKRDQRDRAIKARMDELDAMRSDNIAFLRHRKGKGPTYLLPERRG
ncbi:MAG TPA: hypothetical protein VM487_09685 [Phycisphaerae bacterium]|nr:hypothetical protein [Phycisphaerae bacterium]